MEEVNWSAITNLSNQTAEKKRERREKGGNQATSESQNEIANRIVGSRGVPSVFKLAKI